MVFIHRQEVVVLWNPNHLVWRNTVVSLPKVQPWGSIHNGLPLKCELIIWIQTLSEGTCVKLTTCSKFVIALQQVCIWSVVPLLYLATDGGVVCGCSSARQDIPENSHFKKKNTLIPAMPQASRCPPARKAVYKLTLSNYHIIKPAGRLVLLKHYLPLHNVGLHLHPGDHVYVLYYVTHQTVEDHAGGCI